MRIIYKDIFEHLTFCFGLPFSLPIILKRTTCGCRSGSVPLSLQVLTHASLRAFRSIGAGLLEAVVYLC